LRLGFLSEMSLFLGSDFGGGACGLAGGFAGLGGITPCFLSLSLSFMIQCFQNTFASDWFISLYLLVVLVSVVQSFHS
tara:strand:- start:613 stop:846 length:234 start_codon:yes stop_codon:yes gene_type:complete